jgi:hypothetical protein
MVLVQYWLSIEMQFLEITENKSKTGVATMLAKIWDIIIRNNVKKVLKDIGTTLVLPKNSVVEIPMS